MTVHHIRDTHDARTDTHTPEKPHDARTDHGDEPVARRDTGDVPRATAPAPRVENGSRPPAEQERPAGGDIDQLHARWRDIQGEFVDDPRASVAAADALVGQAIERITSRLNERRREVESGWQRENGDDTERLRVALREYRALLEQLTTLN